MPSSLTKVPLLVFNLLTSHAEFVYSVVNNMAGLLLFLQVMTNLQEVIIVFHSDPNEFKRFTCSLLVYNIAECDSTLLNIRNY